MRTLTHAPGFTATAVVTLAAGIGAAVTMATVYLAVVINPVRLPDPGAVVSIARISRDATQVPPVLSWPRFQATQRAATAFEAMGAYSNESVSLSGAGDAPRELRGIRVSAGFFQTLRLTTAHGRVFTADEDLPNGPAVCVVSFEAWQGPFGGRDLVGRPIRLNGRSTEVVGILPPRLTAPWGDREVFLPRVFEDSQLTPQLVSAGASYLGVVGRLAPGRTRTQAKADLHGITRDYAAKFAGHSDTLYELDVTPLADTIVANRRSTLTLLLGAVAIVLLTSCANAAALVISRLATRRREIAVRQALGATRAAMVKTLVAETLAVAAIAGVGGLLAAQVALSLIAAKLGTLLPPGAALRLDGPALLVAAGAVLGVAVLVGVLPALHATAASSAVSVTAFARGLSDTIATQRFRRTLVIAEVALSAFLLVCAILFIASLDRALRTPVGFDPSGVAAGEITLPADRYGASERQRAFFLDILGRVQALPQIQGAAIAFGLPFAADNYVSPYVIAGQPIPPPAERRRAGLRIVTEDYFAVMGIRLRSGRVFTPADRDGSQPVCIINESLARRQFASGAAVGGAVLRGRDADQRFEIVGVVADVKTNGPTAPAPDELFLPFRQLPRPNASIVIRTASRPETIAPLLQSAVGEQDPDLPVARFSTMEEQLALTLGPERILAQLTAAFALVALLLASVGLYAVLAHSVTARTVEIGIRMAVGAGRPSILRLIVGGAMRLVGVGSLCGLLAAAAASRLIGAQLHDISPHDPLVYAAVATVFVVVGVIASALPARRASRVDPLVCLTATH
jgi:predicted permease